MSPNPSPLASLPWPVLLACVWLGTILTIAVLLYKIAKAAINKTDARDLPTVLTAFAQLVNGITHPLSQALAAGQNLLNGSASAQDVGAPGQTGEQGTSERGAPQ